MKIFCITRVQLFSVQLLKFFRIWPLVIEMLEAIITTCDFKHALEKNKTI